MKHFTQTLFLGLGLMSAMPVMAAVTSTGKTFKGNTPSFLNHNFCKDKQTRLVIENVKDGENNEEVAGYSILDSKLEVVGTFQIPDFPAVIEKKTVCEILQGPLDIQVSDRNEYPEWENVTKEEFIARVTNSGEFIRQEEVDGELRYYSQLENNYYYYEFFGYEYPQEYYYWKDNVGYHRFISYSYDGWGPTGQYGESHETENSYKPQPVGLYPKSAECTDLDELDLTQTLFNDDDLYEYVIPVFGTKAVSYENEYEKVEGTEVYTAGFKVMSQNGSVVAEVKFPSEYYAESRDLDLILYMMDDRNYIFAGLKSGDDEYVDVVYEINAQDASINMVGAPMRMRVTPTTPQRGNDVTVDLGAAAGDNCRVNVVSVSGRTVLSTRVEPGTERMTISTGHLEQGMYVVTVSDGNSSRETAKIIVR